MSTNEGGQESTLYKLHISIQLSMGVVWYIYLVKEKDPYILGVYFKSFQNICNYCLL